MVKKKKTRKKINKETEDLKHSKNQLDLRDLQNILPNKKYTFFLCGQGKFSRIDNILAYKTNLNKFKKTKI